MLRQWLEHPRTRGLELDDPRTTELRREIIRSKPLLRAVYETWYALLHEALPPGPGAVLELGAGAGFFKEFVPQALCSDILQLAHVDLVCSAQELPFAPASLRAVTACNVLHHLPDAGVFFDQAASCVCENGRLLLLEPWVSPLSRVVYNRLHHEPFDPAAKQWRLPPSGPLSGGNNALPWIIFSRDAALFEKRHPQWRLLRATPLAGFGYMFSGGLSLRCIVPLWLHGAVLGLDRLASRRFAASCALFCFLELQRTRAF